MILALKKVVEEQRSSLLGKMFQGAGLTAGGVAVYEFSEFVKSNPTASLNIVHDFGPIFALAVLLTALANRLVGVMEKNSTSTEKMAEAIRQIADKDDRQAERMELMTQYSAQQASEAAASMSKLHDEMRLQNSALDRIEKRQQSFETKLERLDPMPPPIEELKGKGLPT